MAGCKPDFMIRHPEQDVSLRGFESITGTAFTEALCTTYKRRSANSIANFRDVTKAIRLFHQHISSTKPLLLLEIKAGNAEDGFGSKSAWLLYVSSFRRYISEFDRSPKLKNKHISGLNFWLANLQDLGLIPRFPLLSTFKISKVVSKSLLDYCYERSDLSGIGIEVESREELQEVDRMLQSIELDLGRVDSANLPQQAAIVLKKRLSVIRKEAELQFNDAITQRRDGLMAIRRQRHLLPLLDDALNWKKSKATGAINPYKLPIQKLNNDEWWGVVLAWCWYRNSGLEPKWGVTPNRTYNFLRKEFQRRSDTRSDVAIAKSIGCSKHFIANAMILLIHDLCANVDSVRNMPLYADSRDDFGVNDVAWVKPRGAGVLTLLDDQGLLISPSKVVRIIRRATRYYRKVCLPVHSDNLFLHHHSSKGSSKQNKTDTVRPMTPSAETNLKYIKEVIAAASLGMWSGTGRSIRISILLYKGLTGGLIAVQSAGQHKDIKTSQQYANKAPMLLLHDQKMREFRQWLEALVTVDIENVPQKLGIDESEYEKRKQEVLNSRFGGIYCRNAFEGVQPGTTEGEACGKISKCLTCNNRRHLFVASEDNLIHLLHWNDALIKAKADKIIDFEKNQDWLFWAIFIETTVARIEGGGPRYAAMLAGAKQRAKELVNPYMKINFEDVV